MVPRRGTLSFSNSDAMAGVATARAAEVAALKSAAAKLNQLLHLAESDIGAIVEESCELGHKAAT